MNVLITNDDGINSPVLLPLARWAKQFGNVTVIAPKFEQSGKSQSIDIHNPFELERLPDIDGIRFFSLDSTPADCVRYAIAEMDENFGLLISGINRGYNIGEDIGYSGTCGAVFETGYYNIPSVALSTPPEDFNPALSKLDEIRDFFIKNDLFAHCKLWNVNIPLESEGFKITRFGGPYFRDRFPGYGENCVKAEGYVALYENEDPDCDTVAVFNGFISVCPMTVDRTATAVFNALKGKH